MAEKDASNHPWLMERRYFSLVIVLAFVSLSIVAFFLCYRQHTINTAQTLKEDRSAANLLSLVLEEHLKKLVSVMESYAQRPLLLQAVRDKNAEKAVLHLINLKKSNPDVDILIITDKSGTLWSAYPDRPESIGKNFAYRDWYKGVSKEWKPSISDVVLRVVEEKDLAVQISVPFMNEKGEVIGILTNTQRTVGFDSLFKQELLDPGATITITDRKGQIVSNNRQDVEKDIKPYPFHPGMKKALVGKDKTFAFDDPGPGGRTNYISFARLANIGWTVFVERDKRSILLSESAYYIQVTAIAFLLFLSIVFFLAYLRKQVTARQLEEQLQAEQKIRAGEERYKSYIDITMQLAWTTNHKGEIVEDNPSWSKYTGRGYEKIKGFGWIEDIHPDDRDRTEKIWGKAVAEKSPYETEYRMCRYDGVYRDYLARGIPLLDENGSVREWVGTCIDITDRKKVEEELQAKNAELERFAYTISHDLKSPLVTVKTFLGYLSQDLADGNAGRIENDIGYMRTATDKMGALLDELLEMSRIGRVVNQSVQVTFRELAEDALGAVAGRIAERGVAVQVGDEEVTLTGDRPRLAEIWQNLLENAVKFMGDQPSPRIEIGVERQGREKVFYVRDNGIGIDPRHQGKVFGLFEKLDPKIDGTGIGLALVRRIVEWYRGKIWLESEGPGCGTCFRFTLPDAVKPSNRSPLELPDNK